MSNFQPLEVVGHGSEAQLQMGEDVEPMFYLFTRLFIGTIIQKMYI